MWIATLAQVTLVCAIAMLLTSAQNLRHRGRRTLPAQAEPLAA